MITEQIGLDLLRTFVAVCRQGSLNRVARETGRAQSALSMQMRRLETLVERQLFARTGRGVVPTAEGELLLGYATRILALSDEAVARLKEADVKGGVRIGLAEEVATTALPAALGRMHRAYPDLRLDVTVEHSVALGRLWSEAALDILVAPTSVVSGDALATWNVELNWVAARDYAPDPALPLDLVTFAMPCLWRKRMLEALAETGRQHRVTLTSQSVTALQAAIENGIGIGVLPPDSIRGGTMRILTRANDMPPPLLVQYGLYAPARRSTVIDAAVTVLRDAVPAMQGG